MPKLIKIESNSDVSNYMPKEGSVTSFVSQEEGHIKFKYKDSSGNIFDFNDMTTLALMKPENGLHLRVRVTPLTEVVGQDNKTITIIDTKLLADTRQYVRLFNIKTDKLYPCPEDGIDPVYNGLPIYVDITPARKYYTGQVLISYAWYDASHNPPDDYHVLVFPSSYYNEFRLPNPPDTAKVVLQSDNGQISWEQSQVIPDLVSYKSVLVCENNKLKWARLSSCSEV